MLPAAKSAASHIFFISNYLKDGTLDADNEKLYKKLIDEYGKTLRAFNEWWETNSHIYQWEGSNWVIDFNTSEVIASDA